MIDDRIIFLAVSMLTIILICFRYTILAQRAGNLGDVGLAVLLMLLACIPHAAIALRILGATT